VICIGFQLNWRKIEPVNVGGTSNIIEGNWYWIRPKLKGPQ